MTIVVILHVFIIVINTVNANVIAIVFRKCSCDRIAMVINIVIVIIIIILLHLLLLVIVIVIINIIIFNRTVYIIIIIIIYSIIIILLFCLCYPKNCFFFNVC